MTRSYKKKASKSGEHGQRGGELEVNKNGGDANAARLSGTVVRVLIVIAVLGALGEWTRRNYDMRGWASHISRRTKSLVGDLISNQSSERNHASQFQNDFASAASCQGTEMGGTCVASEAQSQHETLSKCDRSSLALDTRNPEFARRYSFPNDVEKVELLFDFEESSEFAGGTVFVRLNEHDLELGFFDPTTEDLIEWGYFDDCYVRISPNSETKNSVGLHIPRRWLLGNNELIFGVRIEGASVTVDEKIVVLATLASGEIIPIYKWEVSE